jgi:hypothetical protein
MSCRNKDGKNNRGMFQDAILEFVQRVSGKPRKLFFSLVTSPFEIQTKLKM